MRYEPHEYQTRALEWVLDRPRCCLFLDMGLGKSVIALTAVRMLKDNAEVSSVMVVAPKKVAETTWTQEAAKWDHLRSLSVVPVTGNAAQRERSLETPADVHVIGRDSLVWLCGYYSRKRKRPPFDMWVLDELTSFKNGRSQRSRAVRRMSERAYRVVGLTGTPAPNGLLDLWAEMLAVDKGESLGRSLSAYRQAYFTPVTWNGIIIKCPPKRGAEEAVRARLKDTCLSMEASEWLSLPPVLEHTVTVRLSPEVMRMYGRFERDRVMELQGEDITAQSAAALMSKLGQLANGSVYDRDGNARQAHTEKAEALAELVEQALSPVLVFYQFRHDIPCIRKALPSSCRVREYSKPSDLEDWNAGRIDVLLAHPASSAYGLNMQQGGCYVVWYGTGWNLEHYMQGNARLHRQGQTRPVTVYRLVCGGTVDEMALRAIESKRNAQDAVMDGLRLLREKHGGKGDGEGR